jgi:hypothetical protein
MWYDEVRSYPAHTWKQESWEDRVQAFLKTDDSPERFNWPFPMGVFGTLRQYQGNNRLMHETTVEKHRLAFLPHFYAQSLGIGHATNACAPFEVFYYKPEDFSRMIFRVDRLESFDPQVNHGGSNNSYYFRTLVWLRLLPEGYEDEWFPKTVRADIWGHRDMAIDPKNWDKYERVPAWVYSNMRATKPASKEQQSPIIWPKE